MKLIRPQQNVIIKHLKEDNIAGKHSFVCVRVAAQAQIGQQKSKTVFESSYWVHRAIGAFRQQFEKTSEFYCQANVQLINSYDPQTVLLYILSYIMSP